MSRIAISPKHGVNPTVLHCPVCYKETDLALLGRLPEDKGAPRNSPQPNPCDECVACMEKGVIFRVRKGDDQKGDILGIFGLTEEAVRRLIKPGPVLYSVLAKRVCDIDETAARGLGWTDDGTFGGLWKGGDQKGETRDGVS